MRGLQALHRSATTDRALVKRLGQRFESARRLSFSLDLQEKLTRREEVSKPVSGLTYRNLQKRHAWSDGDRLIQRIDLMVKHRDLREGSYCSVPRAAWIRYSYRSTSR
jgi:hypothetical protein